MKKIIPFALMLLLLTACGKKEETPPSNVSPPKNVTAPVSSDTKTAAPAIKRPPPPSPAKQAYSRETRSATRPGMQPSSQGNQKASAGYMQCPKTRPNRSVGIVPYRCESGVALMNIGMCGVTLQAAGPLDGGFFFIGLNNTEEQGIYAGDKGYIQRRGDTIFLYNAQRQHIATCKTEGAP